MTGGGSGVACGPGDGTMGTKKRGKRDLPPTRWDDGHDGDDGDDGREVQNARTAP